jgi:hypothetical protein
MQTLQSVSQEATLILYVLCATHLRERLSFSTRLISDNELRFSPDRSASRGLHGHTNSIHSFQHGGKNKDLCKRIASVVNL